jgi:hypothetical protein
MKLSYRIREAELIPKGYGIAYRLWNQDAYIVLPIPINIIVRVFLNYYYALVKAWYPSRWERKLDTIWRYGVEVGRSDRQHEIEILKITCELYKDLITRIEKERGK